MAHFYSADGVVPVVHPRAFIHASATLGGDVIVGAGCYVGPSASLRGDFGRIELRAGSNVQDCAVLHSGGGERTVVGERAIIGHGAVLHGCTIGINALVGINAVVLDGAEIGEQAMIAAMSLVRAGLRVPRRMLAMGIPAEVVRRISKAELAYLVKGEALYYSLTQGRIRPVRRPLSKPRK